MTKTTIQWTDHSTNPIRATKDGAVGHYCELASPGCANCYASALQKRFKMPPFGSNKNRDNVSAFLDEHKLREVMNRKKPTKYFWCDMTDMFGEWVNDVWLYKIFAAMSGSPQHTHQVLTKRPARMAEFIQKLKHDFDRLEAAGRQIGIGLKFQGIPLVPWPIPSVWLGTSVESQKYADERIPELLKCDAAVRFLSVEPLLDYVDLSTYLHGIQWVIVGGESGRKARKCNLQWVRDVVIQCQLAGVSCFVKQLGANIDCDENDAMFDWFSVSLPLLDKKGGDPSEWPDFNWPREFPA